MQVSAEEYAAAQPDPVAKFSGPVCGHMNAVRFAVTAVQGGGPGPAGSREGRGECGAKRGMQPAE